MPEPPKPEQNPSGLQIPQDLYGYIAGGASALLLGTLAWLRRQRQATPPAAPITDHDDTKDHVVTAHKPSQTDTADFTVSSMEDEHEFLSDDSMFTRPQKAVDAQYDEVLYKVDVYCQYGQTTQAMALLENEFNQQPTAHHYALRLLALYGEQQQKSNIIAFVSHLNALGKKTDHAFWQDVTALVCEVCPEALNPSNDKTLPNSADTEDLTDFSTMTFEDLDNQEIRFGDLDPQHVLVKASADFFESSVQFEDKKATAAFGEFVFTDEDTDAQQPPTNAPHLSLPSETIIAESIKADVQTLEFALTTLPEAIDLPAHKEDPLAVDTHVAPSAAPLFDADMSDHSIPFDMGQVSVEKLDVYDTDTADTTHAITTTLTLDETFNAPAHQPPTLELEVDVRMPQTPSLTNEEPLSHLDFDFGDFDGHDAALSLEKAQEPSTASPLSLDLDLDFGDLEAHFNAQNATQETQTLALQVPLATTDKAQAAIEPPIEPVIIGDDQPLSQPHAKMSADLATLDDTVAFDLRTFELIHTDPITTHTTTIDLEKDHPTEHRFETTAFPLTKRLDEKTDDPVAYLEMSDAEFAEALAEDVLKKCQIKEQLCRQKIAQEVLNKLR